MKRFTLYGSPHSLPTYKVALMLKVSGEPFSFRYVSFQKGMHKAREFLALSRLGADTGSRRPWAHPSAIGGDRRAFGSDTRPVPGT